MAEKKVDTTKPEGKWTFNGDVTEAFDDMLERSIPQYDIMRQTCFEIAKRFAQRGTSIVDLGCSRGEAIAELVKHFGAYNHFIGVEVSQPMLEAAQKRFESWIKLGIVDIRNLDLRGDYLKTQASVTLAILTIQFTPIEYRLRILRNIYNNTIEGGAFIMVEKVLGGSAEVDELMANCYHDTKRNQGYSEEEIYRKKLSLEGVLVPVTAKWNEELLQIAGWKQYDCFWRWMNFAGWVAIK